MAKQSQMRARVAWRRVLEANATRLPTGAQELAHQAKHHAEREFDSRLDDTRYQFIRIDTGCVKCHAAPTQAEVVHKAFRGAEILYTLRLASGRKVLALVPSHHNHALGEKIGIRLDVDHVVAFRPEA